MTLRLKPTKSLGRRTRKIVRNEINASLHGLAQPDLNHEEQDEVVHEVRKHLKKVRAVFRLTQGGLQKKTYRRCKSDFRKTAAPLRDVRDAHVLIETFDKLICDSHENLSLRACADFRELLETRKQQICDEFWTTELNRGRTGRILRKVRRNFDHANLDRVSWQILREGLKEIYIAGSQALNIAAADQTSEHLHEWRKLVKQLWYQLQVLGPVWRKVQGEFGSDLHRLSEILGEDHDLAVLHQVVTAEANAAGHDTDLEELTLVIDRRRSELKRAALDLGQYVFRYRPKVLIRKIEAWWQAKLDSPD